MVKHTLLGEALLYPPSTLSIEGCCWSAARPGCFVPGKGARYELCRSVGGPRGRSGWVRKILPSSGYELRTLQAVASPYTDYAIPARLIYIYIYIHTPVLSKSNVVMGCSWRPRSAALLTD